MCRIKIRLLYDKVKYELPVFLLLLIQAIPQRYLDYSEDIYPAFLAIDYGAVGFAPRAFLGSVMKLFFDYRGRREQNIFFGVIMILTFLLVSWMAGRLIRLADDDVKKTTIFFVALFLAGPYSNAVLFSKMFQPDRVLALFTLLGLLVMNIRPMKWLLPFIIFAALATHNMFTFSFMPAIALLLLYEVYASGYSKSSKWFCAVNYLTMFVFTAYFYLYGFFPGLQKTTLDELIAYVGANTDVQIHEKIFSVYLFTEPDLVFDGLRSLMLTERIIRSEIRVALFFAPIILLFLFIWKNSFSASKNKFEKFIFTLCLLVPLARIPLYFVHWEVYRGRVAVVFVQFMLLFYFLYRKNSAVTQSVKRVGGFLQRNTLLVLLLLGFLAMAFVSFNFSDPWRAFFTRFVDWQVDW